MPTKTEYREYIASEAWQKRRKDFLKFSPDCNRCGLPRWLAIIAYDQDLHVHHKSYENLGLELDGDLEPLCKRCHEVESFGSSKLHQPKQVECKACRSETWDVARRICPECEMITRIAVGDVSADQFLNRELLDGFAGIKRPWPWMLVIDSILHLVREGLEHRDADD